MPNRSSCRFRCAVLTIALLGASCTRTPPVAVTRAIGTEPFWSVDVRTDRMLLTRPDADSLVYPYVPVSVRDSGVFVFASRRYGDDTTLMLTIVPGACSDGMSDRAYPAKATMERGAVTLRGCATAVPDTAHPAR